MVNLTQGAIANITNGGATAAELKPTLQVTELKQVQTKQPQQSDRFRLVLSDGTHLQQAMLGTQINHLVKEGNLRSGSIVTLIQYTCTTVQGRMIIIILELIVVMEESPLIGRPVSAQKSLPSNTSPPSFGGGGGAAGGSFSTVTVGNTNSSSMASAYPSRTNLSSASSVSAPSGFPPPAAAAAMGAYAHPPPSMYSNRGPVAKNEAPARIVPITALNPYLGRWTIKARVTAKGEMRHYNNPRGDGKVFSFDLLDSSGGEIRVTCFNAVADQFHDQIELGRVYMISKGSLKPAQKNFNHLHNDLEIFLESTSTIQPCVEDDGAIPKQQFHFRPISEVEGMESNSVMDVIGVVSSITPTSSIMRKNGTETQKRSLQLKDASGRSVELTIWGSLCNSDGQKLQSICDAGGFPILAAKSVRVNDFSGKAVGTIASSQMFIEPDFPEAFRLREWFDKEGRNLPSISISRETSGTGRIESVKTISQIKDEKLGTSEKPDWIMVTATIIFVKSDNFCYPACPIVIGDRACNKKVTNNGDGRWRCERCDRSVDECDYRYILQFQIQDHTSLTWVTAFQESGEEIMGVPAKDLHYLKHEKQDDESFSKILRSVLFSRFVFKLKVKEESFSDELRVKSSVVKADKVNYSTFSRSLLDLIKSIPGASSLPPAQPHFGTNPTPFNRTESPATAPAPYGNFYGGGQRFPAPSGSAYQPYCTGCGASGHTSAQCPSTMSAPAYSPLGEYGGRLSVPGGAVSGECFKCHQTGHWARDCPTALNAAPPAHGGRYGGSFSRQQLGGY